MARLAYQYRLYPYGEQAQKLEGWLLLCQRLYNAALEQRITAYHLGKRVGYKDQQAELVALKKELPEYAEVPSHVLQNVLLRLDRAFENFFRRCKENPRGKKLGFPKFKGKERYLSLTCPDAYPYLRKGCLNFPKIGMIRLELHRLLPVGAIIKTCTIKKQADGWYASFSLEVETKAAPLHSGPVTAIDLGLTSFLVLADGEEEKSPKFLHNSEKKLKKAQKKLSKKNTWSKKRAKQKTKLAKLHLKVRRQRADFQWKLARKLTQEFSVIGVENLNIKGMLKGNYLAKSISDASWGAFKQKLQHVAIQAGCKIVQVDPRGTSQRCSKCQVVVKKELSERWHNCPFCGLSIGRDHNAAINILKIALGQDMPELTPKESRTTAFRYKRKASPLADLGTVSG